MIASETRLELLRLTKPATDNPDMQAWISKAKELEAYVHEHREAAAPEKGQAQAPATELDLGSPEDRTSQSAPAKKKR